MNNLWLTLRERSGIFSPDLVCDRPVFRQFCREAGIRGAVREEDYDALLRAAGEHGYGIEVSSGENKS
ncbi:MAG: hypothetical protein DDT20_00846 [Firmicutes bacterium]|nr:hypothetical protein [Bacillota bacterium]